MQIQTINLATKEALQYYLFFKKAQVNDLIDAAFLSYQGWWRADFAVRWQYLLMLAKITR